MARGRAGNVVDYPTAKRVEGVGRCAIDRGVFRIRKAEWILERQRPTGLGIKGEYH